MWITNLLCRVGIHNFKSYAIHGTGSGIEGEYVYKKCERCPKSKWGVIRVDNSLHDEIMKHE